MKTPGSSNASNQADQLDEIMLVLKDIWEEMVNIKQRILALELSDQDQKTYFWRQSPGLFIYTSYTESLTCSYHDGTWLSWFYLFIAAFYTL